MIGGVALGLLIDGWMDGEEGRGRGDDGAGGRVGAEASEAEVRTSLRFASGSKTEPGFPLTKEIASSILFGFV